MDDLQRAYEALSGKTASLDTLYAYYDGEHPALYSSQRMRAVLAQTGVSFSENWMATVVDVLLDRLNIASVSIEGARDEALQRLWTAEALDIESDEVHADVAIGGESYVIVWRGDGPRARVYHNDPRLCTVFYDAADPAIVRMAAKWWEDEDERRHLTLYYPDRFEHYVSRSKARELAGYEGLAADGEEPNETGVVPVFCFRQSSRRSRGEILPILPVQRALNRLLDDMLASSEYGAFRQRYAVTNADPDDFRAAPGTTVTFPPNEQGQEATQIGQFEATDLKNFGDEIDRLAGHIASLSRTPRSAFFDQGANISGDALVAMEAQLARKAARYQERLMVTWRKVLSFALALDGVGVDEADIHVAWDDARIVQPMAEAQILQAQVASGVPLVTALRRAGWNEAAIAQLVADKAEEERARASLSAPMLEAVRRAQAAMGSPE